MGLGNILRKIFKTEPPEGYTQEEWTKSTNEGMGYLHQKQMQQQHQKQMQQQHHNHHNINNSHK